MSTTCCFCFPSTSSSVHQPHRKDRKSSAVPNDLSALKMRDAYHATSGTQDLKGKHISQLHLMDTYLSDGNEHQYQKQQRITEIPQLTPQWEREIEGNPLSQVSKQRVTHQLSRETSEIIKPDIILQSKHEFKVSKTEAPQEMRLAVAQLDQCQIDYPYKAPEVAMSLGNLIYAAKVMHYKCFSCSKQFQKQLLGSFNLQAEYKKVPSVNALHEVFNTSEAVKCPFCCEIVSQLINMDFVLGNHEELEAYDYAKICDSREHQPDKDVAVYQHKQIVPKESKKPMQLLISSLKPPVKKADCQSNGKESSSFKDSNGLKNTNAETVHLAQASEISSELEEAAVIGHFTPIQDKHRINPEECKRFNGELMKSMIYKKTKRNISYQDFLQGKHGKGQSNDIIVASQAKAQKQECVIDAVQFQFFK